MRSYLTLSRCFSAFSIIVVLRLYLFFFFFNDTATTEIYTLSLHDALPICATIRPSTTSSRSCEYGVGTKPARSDEQARGRSEEHTSELQSRQYLVCRLLLEKKKQ